MYTLFTYLLSAAARTLLIYCPETRVLREKVYQSISQLPKLCVKITIFMQGHVLIADWYVAHFVVMMNDVMNDNMAAFGQQTNQLSGRGLT